MSYRVYRYTFPDGRMYIGVTKNKIETRRDQGYQHNKPLREAIRSTGWAGINVDILEEGLDQNEAFIKEQYYIRKFNTSNPVYGYNVSLGGKATFEGLHHTEEHKRYISAVLKGREFSDVHIEHLRESHSGERKPVIRYMDDGSSIKYKSLGDAALAVDGHKTNISRACRSGRIYKHSQWAFLEGGDER